MALHTNNTDDKKKKSPSHSEKRPLKSGKVKGPMGVGRNPAESGSKTRESDQNDNSGVARTSADGGSSSSYNLSSAPSSQQMSEPQEPKERLPERTSMESEALQVVESKRKRKESEIKHELESGQTIALSESTGSEPWEPSEQVKADTEISKPQAKPSPPQKETPKPEASDMEESTSEDIKRKGAKKMSRQKFVKGISAEEKLKLDNVSPSEELKSRIAESALGFWDTITPGDEIKDEVAEILLKIIPTGEQVASFTPSMDQINKIATGLTKGISTDSISLDKILEQIPDPDIRQQIRMAVSKLKKDTP